MNPSHLPHARTATFGACRMGAAWLDSGVATGLVVIDSNRPAPGAGTARGLLEQFGAAH